METKEILHTLRTKAGLSQDALAEKAAKGALEKLGGSPVPSGAYKVIFER